MSHLSDATLQSISNMESMWRQVETIRTRVRGSLLHRRPENSFTLREYCDRYHLPESTARRQLAKMVRQDLLLYHHCLLPDSQGRIVSQSLYVINGNMESARA